MKKSRLQELAGIKKPLSEGYAWERGADGKLPTLASSTARHAANENVTDSEEDKLDQISKELNKASKMHKGQSEKIANLVKEEYNLKIKTIAEELVELVKQDESRGGALSGGSVNYPVFYDLASAIMEKHKVR